VSADAPYLDIVYKLVRFDNRDVKKLSPGKRYLAGEKQVFRRQAADGRYLDDTIGLRAETIGGAAPLLETVMARGRRLRPAEPLDRIRDRLGRSLPLLDARYKRLEDAERFPVAVSRGLEKIQGRR